MPDATELIKLIKQAAVSAVSASKPAEVVFGKVTGENPLMITVDQKMTLGENQLILSRNVTDFETEVSVLSEYGWQTQNRAGGSGFSEYASHNHDIVIDRLKITVHNKLEAGDRVLLVRQQGGQKYVVLDRVVAV